MSYLRCHWQDNGRCFVMLHLNCLAVQANFNIVNLSFILQSFTTICGLVCVLFVEECVASTRLGKRWTFAKCILSTSDCGNFRSFTKNDLTTPSLSSRFSVFELIFKPWERTLNSFERSSFKMSDLRFSSLKLSISSRSFVKSVSFYYYYYEGGMALYDCEVL